MEEAEIVRLVIELALVVGTAFFAKEFRRYKDAFVEVAEAVKDDKVTWDEAKEIVKALEE